MGGDFPLTELNQLVCQINGITFYHQVKVEVGLFQEQVTNRPANKVELLPPISRNGTSSLHKVDQLSG